MNLDLWGFRLSMGRIRSRVTHGGGFKLDPIYGAVSDEFEDAIQGGGGTRCTCDFCGREHFADGLGSDSWDWEEGEREELRRRAESEPGQVVAQDYDAVVYGVIAGRAWVLGCPCGRLLPYERFLIADQDAILRFYRLRGERLLREAEREGARKLEAEELAEGGPGRSRGAPPGVFPAGRARPIDHRRP